MRMRRAVLRWFCHGTGTSKVLGAMISREASMIAVARLALEIFSLLSSSARRRAGKTSWTQSAMRLAGSG